MKEAHDSREVEALDDPATQTGILVTLDEVQKARQAYHITLTVTVTDRSSLTLT